MQQGVLQTGEARAFHDRARGEDYLRSTGDIRRLAVLSWLQANHLRGAGESARLSYYPRFTFIIPVPTKLLRKRPITVPTLVSYSQNDASKNKMR